MRFRKAATGLLALALALSVAVVAANAGVRTGEANTANLTQPPVCQSVLTDIDDIYDAHILETGHYCYKHVLSNGRTLTMVVLTEPFNIPQDPDDTGPWFQWNFNTFNPGVVAKTNDTIGTCGTSDVGKLRAMHNAGQMGLQKSSSSSIQGNLKRHNNSPWRTKDSTAAPPNGSKIWAGVIAHVRYEPDGNSGCAARIRYVVRVEAQNETAPPPPTPSPDDEQDAPPRPTGPSDVIQTADCNTGRGSKGDPETYPNWTSTNPTLNVRSYSPYHVDSKNYTYSGWHQHSSDATPRGCHNHSNTYVIDQNGDKVGPSNVDRHTH